jgi:hypothetical protein
VPCPGGGGELLLLILLLLVFLLLLFLLLHILLLQVVDLQPPTVTGCPNSRTVFLEPGERARAVPWTEPAFADNVKIEHVMTR